MEINEKFSELEQSDCFKSWRKDHKASYLAHVFRMFDEANANIWQFGYYNPDDKITTFIMEGDKINMVPEQNIFKKDNVKVAKIDVSLVQIDFSDAMEKAKKILSDKYRQHPVIKSFAILQMIGNQQVYNITFVTQTFNTLNIRIDTQSGEIVAENFSSLMDMAKFEAGSKDGKIADKKKSDQSYIG